MSVDPATGALGSDADGPAGPAPWLFGLICSTGAVLGGFLTIVIPYIASQHGLSIAAIGSIIAASNFAVPFKLLWTPILDMTGTLKGWVLAGGVLTIVATTALMLVPITPGNFALLALLAFVAGTMGEVGRSAASGLLVLTVAKSRLGTAAAFSQGGALILIGVGGAAGLWIATHIGLAATVLFVGGMMLITFLPVLLIAEPVRMMSSEGLGARVKRIGIDVVEMARNRRRLWVMLCFLTPIGVGGASFLWAAIAPEWHAGADIVALVNGAAAAIVSAAGAFVYARFADRFDRAKSLLGTAALLVLAALLLAALPRTPMAFVIGTLVYAFFLGFAWTAFGALQYETVGGGAAATKNALLSAVGNLPIAYMPVVLGYVHDGWSTTIMLLFEGGLTTACIVAFAIALPRGTHDRYAVDAPLTA